jgi:hypothetical protein
VCVGQKDRTNLGESVLLHKVSRNSWGGFTISKWVYEIEVSGGSAVEMMALAEIWVMRYHEIYMSARAKYLTQRIFSFP